MFSKSSSSSALPQQSFDLVLPTVSRPPAPPAADVGQWPDSAVARPAKRADFGSGEPMTKCLGRDAVDPAGAKALLSACRTPDVPRVLPCIWSDRCQLDGCSSLGHAVQVPSG